jgi:hypothetical protein
VGEALLLGLQLGERVSVAGGEALPEALAQALVHAVPVALPDALAQALMHAEPLALRLGVAVVQAV